MHLGVVSKDLSYFAYIHRSFKGNERFEIETTFPDRGDYKLIAEITPVGATDYCIENHWVNEKTLQKNPLLLLQIKILPKS